jgi:hypothetical protein
MAISSSRVAAVAFGLVAVGFVCGAVLGALVSVLESGVSMEHLTGVLAFGAMFGAPIGAVITPVVGFLFARRAPLWKAIVVGAIGVLLGAAAVVPFGVWGLVGAIPGFFIAMVVLYIQTAARTRSFERAA